MNETGSIRRVEDSNRRQFLKKGADEKALWISLSPLTLGAICTLAFELSEPVFTYRSGWASLPQRENVTSETVDSEWAKQSAVADKALNAGRNKTHAPALSAALGSETQFKRATARRIATIQALAQMTIVATARRWCHTQRDNIVCHMFPNSNKALGLAAHSTVASQAA